MKEKYNYNIWKKILSEMRPHDRIKVIPHNEEDKEIAEQYQKLLNYKLDEELEKEILEGSYGMDNR